MQIEKERDKMSWKEEIKKFKGSFPDDKARAIGEDKRALEIFAELTDENWESISFNSIGLLSRYLDDYAEKRPPEVDDNKYMVMKEVAVEINELEMLLEDLLLDVRELLIDIGM